MTQHDDGHGARHVRLADLPRAEIDDHIWHPLRRALGATGFGVGAYSAARAGDVLVGTHDETGAGSNRHEELYVVLRGRALVELGTEELELGPEEFLLVEPQATRGLRALADDTSVLVIGGTPGAISPAPYEHWYAALTADDPAESAVIAAEGLTAFPRHGQLHYQLACFNALAGNVEAAAAHLRQAVTSDERAWEWLLDDADLDVLRDLPGLVPTRQSCAPVHVEQAGSGLDVVLLHAGIADRRMWDPQWVEWPRDLRVTRLDFRGFGHSQRPKGEFSHGDDVVAVLDALGLERPILVGASFGGRVALEVALARPDRVSGLVLVGAGLPDQDWTTELEEYGAAEEAALAAGDLDGATDLNVDFWLPTAPDWVRAAIREQQRRALELQATAEEGEVPLRAELATRLGEIEVPALVLVGESDRADFRAIAGRLAGELPNARLVVIPSATHLPSLEQPEAFETAVRPFLESVG